MYSSRPARPYDYAVCTVAVGARLLDELRPARPATDATDARPLTIIEASSRNRVPTVLKYTIGVSLT